MEETLASVHADAFSLQGSGLGVFPSIRKPQVLFAAIDPAPGLMDLQTTLEQSLHALGLDADPKPFHPHVTIARLRHARARAVRAYLRTRTTFALAPFDAAQYTLYESTLRPEGALHTPHCSFSLHPSPKTV
jgi:2'-5' RNA ligase